MRIFATSEPKLTVQNNLHKIAFGGLMNKYLHFSEGDFQVKGIQHYRSYLSIYWKMIIQGKALAVSVS